MDHFTWESYTNEKVSNNAKKKKAQQVLEMDYNYYFLWWKKKKHSNHLKKEMSISYRSLKVNCKGNNRKNEWEAGNTQTQMTEILLLVSALD